MQCNGYRSSWNISFFISLLSCTDSLSTSLQSPPPKQSKLRRRYDLLAAIVCIALFFGILFVFSVFETWVDPSPLKEPVGHPAGWWVDAVHFIRQSHMRTNWRWVAAGHVFAVYGCYGNSMCTQLVSVACVLSNTGLQLFLNETKDTLCSWMTLLCSVLWFRKAPPLILLGRGSAMQRLTLCPSWYMARFCQKLFTHFVVFCQHTYM